MLHQSVADAEAAADTAGQAGSTHCAGGSCRKWVENNFQPFVLCNFITGNFIRGNENCGGFLYAGGVIMFMPTGVFGCLCWFFC